MESSSNEKKIVMAFEAFKKNPKLTIWAASRIYKIPCTTLMEWHIGKQSQNNISINSKKFTNLKKKVVFDCIIELINQRFLPKQKDIWNMVDFLCNIQNMSYIKPWWVKNFVQQQLLFNMQFWWKINY